MGRMCRFNGFFGIGFLVALALVSSCGTVQTERGTEFRTEKYEFPPYNGPRQQVQIVELTIPDEIVQKYPELQEKRVGWGMYNRIVEALYDSGRFELLESRTDLQRKILETWEVSESGLAAEDEAIEGEGLDVAEYLVYAEIFEFSVRTGSTAVGIAASDEETTIVGLQIRVVDVKDGSFVPASGVGKATTTSAGVWAPELEFDQSTVGLATQRAVVAALQSALRRLE